MEFLIRVGKDEWVKSVDPFVFTGDCYEGMRFLLGDAMHFRDILRAEGKKSTLNDLNGLPLWVAAPIALITLAVVLYIVCNG